MGGRNRSTVVVVSPAVPAGRIAKCDRSDSIGYSRRTSIPCCQTRWVLLRQRRTRHMGERVLPGIEGPIGGNDTRVAATRTSARTGRFLESSQSPAIQSRGRVEPEPGPPRGPGSPLANRKPMSRIAARGARTTTRSVRLSGRTNASTVTRAGISCASVRAGAGAADRPPARR